MPTKEFKGFPRASNGVEGLDDILGGGFPINRSVKVGRELREFQGVLTGRLEYRGESEPLLGEHEGGAGEAASA